MLDVTYFISSILDSLNTRRSQATKKTPFEIVFGQEPNLLSHLNLLTDEEGHTYEDDISNVVESLNDNEPVVNHKRVVKKNMSEPSDKNDVPVADESATFQDGDAEKDIVLSDTSGNKNDVPLTDESATFQDSDVDNHNVLSDPSSNKNDVPVADESVTFKDSDVERSKASVIQFIGVTTSCHEMHSNDILPPVDFIFHHKIQESAEKVNAITLKGLLEDKHSKIGDIKEVKEHEQGHERLNVLQEFISITASPQSESEIGEPEEPSSSKADKLTKCPTDLGMLVSYADTNLYYFKSVKFDNVSAEELEVAAATLEIYEEECDALSALLKKHIPAFNICNNKYVDQKLLLIHHIISKFHSSDKCPAPVDERIIETSPK